MDVASYLLSALAMFQVGDDGLRSALVKPQTPVQSQASAEAQSAPANVPSGEVRPAFDQSTVVSATGSITNARNTNQLLERMLVSGQSATGERRLNLTAAISAVDANRRLETVEAYWQLSELYARRCALQRQLARLDECQSIAASQLELDLAAAAWQRHLADLKTLDAEFQQTATTFGAMTNGNFRTPILPESLPHAGGYETRFDSIFASSAASTEVQLLNQRIPAWRKVVDARTEGVIAAEDAYQAFAQATSAGGAPLVETIAAAEQLYQSELAFLASVYQYNADIAEYALAVGGEQTPQVLVGMLIKDRAIPASAADMAERVIPVSGSDGFRAASSDTSQTNTGNNASVERTPGQAAPRTFQPPIDAGPLTPAHSNDAGQAADSSSRRAQQPTTPQTRSPNSAGWEPVPGYKREGERTDDSNGQPTPAKEMRPLSDRYQSNYRGPGETWQPRTLTQHLASSAGGDEPAGRSLTLCEVWEQTPRAHRAALAARFWEACFAGAILRERETQEQQFRDYQRQLLASAGRPQRDLEMLTLHAGLKQVRSERLEAKLKFDAACLALGSKLNSPGSTTVAAFPLETGETYTQFETQLQATANESWGANLAAWQTAIEETSRNVSGADREFPSGGAVRTLLFAWEQHQETLHQGLTALVDFRAEVARQIARNVSADAQCQALMN